MKKNMKKAPWLNQYQNIPHSVDYYKGSISMRLEETAKKYPWHIAYEYYGIECNYQDFIKKIENAARGLKFLGVRKDDRVTICMPNTPEAIIMFYAVNMVGAIANMIHPLSSEKEIEFYLNGSQSKVALIIDIVYNRVMRIINNTKVEKLVIASAAEQMSPLYSFMYKTFKNRPLKRNELWEDAILWSDFISDGKYYKGIYKVERTAEDPMAILYSGGTTGNPKGALISNLGFNSTVEGVYYMVDQLRPGNIFLALMPIFHNFGLAINIHAPLVHGMKIILIPEIKPANFGNLIKKYRPNGLAVVPTLYDYLSKSKNFHHNDMASVTAMICGGDILSEDLRKRIEDFAKKYGSTAKIRVGYGLTEGVASCLEPEFDHRPGSLGIPLPDSYYKIVKINTHDELPYGEDGEICISGPSLMMEYINNPEETMQILRKHSDGKIWLHTGDLGSMDADGFVYFKQRIKRIIVSNGYNLYPTYIEDVLNRHPAILTSTVIGIDHDSKGQVAKAFVVLKDNFNLTDELRKEIKNHCRKYIAKYSLPWEYEFRDSLPKTLVGKVAIKELEEQSRSK